MNHDTVITVDLPVALVRVFRCECGYVLGTITHQMMVAAAGLPTVDALEETLWRAHARHQKEATTLEGATRKEITQ